MQFVPFKVRNKALLKLTVRYLYILPSILLITVYVLNMQCQPMFPHSTKLTLITSKRFNTRMLVPHMPLQRPLIKASIPTILTLEPPPLLLFMFLQHMAL